MPDVVLAFLIMKFAFAMLSWLEFTTRITMLHVPCKFFAYEKQRADHLKLRLEKMLHLSEVTEMSEHNKSLLACRMIPTIKGILRAGDSKYRELTSKTEITDFFIFCQEKPFGNLFSKIRLKLAREFLILRNPTKSRIAVFALRPQ
jgi:hypothetical protein